MDGWSIKHTILGIDDGTAHNPGAPASSGARRAATQDNSKARGAAPVGRSGPLGALSTRSIACCSSCGGETVRQASVWSVRR